MNPHPIPEAPPATESILDAATASQNRLVIALLLVSTLVAILNETIMSLAIPHLMSDAGITASTAQWLNT